MVSVRHLKRVGGINLQIALPIQVIGYQQPQG